MTDKEQVNKIIEQGNAVVELKNTKGWTEVIKPWFERTIENYKEKSMINFDDLDERGLRKFAGYAGEYRGILKAFKIFEDYTEKARKVQEKVRKEKEVRDAV